MHTADRLAADPDVQLKAIFGPQHGFRSDLQDNMIETPHARDARRRVPIFSLYSETREPTAEMLADIDVLVIDLQDVGTRVYTYIYTMANCMRAAARHGVRVVVCDRPNPVGGEAIEGATLQPEYASFVGQFPIPLRHGMTIGELARLFNDAFGLNAALDVVPLEGWQRSMYYDETGLPWVIPSPNLPTLDSVDRVSRRGAVRGHDVVGRAGHDAAVRADRGAVDRRRSPGRGHERARGCPACISGRSSSNRRSRSTPGRPAAAARFTSSTARRSRPCARPWS